MPALDWAAGAAVPPARPAPATQPLAGALLRGLAAALPLAAGRLAAAARSADAMARRAQGSIAAEDSNYFAGDPNTCLLKLRQLAKGLAQSVASRVGLFTTPDEKQADLLRRLQDHGIVPREVGALFHEVRRAGNDAKHKLADEHRTALMALKFAWQLSVWFHRSFKEAGFKPGPFLPPAPPANEGAELKVKLDAIRSVRLSWVRHRADAH